MRNSTILAQPLGEQEKEVQFDSFIKHIERSAIAYARKLSPEFAEDAFVDASVDLWQNFERVVSVADNLERYFLGMVKCSCRRLGAKERKHRGNPSLEMLEEDYGWEPACYAEPRFHDDIDFQLAFAQLEPQLQLLSLLITKGFTTAEIAKELSTTHYKVVKLRVKARVLLTVSQLSTGYPYSTKPSLTSSVGSERWWTRQDLIEDLGQCKSWVQEHLIPYVPSAEIRPIPGDRRTLYYPPYVRDKLAELVVHYPPAGDQFSGFEIGHAIGKSQYWVERRLRGLGIASEDRLSRKNSRVMPHWKPEVITLLQTEASSAKMKGSYLTIEELSNDAVLKRGRKWISNRIMRMGFKPQIRLDPRCGELFECYPPRVLKRLRETSAEEKPAGCWWPAAGRTVYYVGRSSNWIAYRLEEFGVVGELRTTASGKVSVHYPPCIIEILRQLAKIDDTT